MTVPNRFILQQAPVIAGLGKALLSSMIHRARGRGGVLTTPGPEVVATIPPRSMDLVRHYVKHVGGDPSSYRRTLPAHLFPQWGFPLATQVLSAVDYPLQKGLNAGCRMEIHQELPANEPLTVRARLESIDDNGRRVLLKTRIVSGTSADPDALVGYLFALIPLGKGKGSKNGDGHAKAGAPEKKERPRVPSHARELKYWKLGSSAGLEYAKLTGDFNPIHWLPAYARASGFRNCILHGFATMAYAVEGLNRGLFAGDVQAIRVLDVSFTSPLVLPAKVGLYLADDQRIFVGDAPGGRAYLTGHFES
jgi:hypothetical protein